MEITSIRHELQTALQKQGYSNETIRVYSSNLRQLSEYFGGKDLHLVAEDEIVEYLEMLIERRKLSPQRVVSARAACLTYFTKVLGKEIKLRRVKIPKVNKKAAQLFTREEIRAILDNASNLKHKVIFAVAYSAGLETRELLTLKASDIDLKNQILTIKGAKAIGGGHRKVTRRVVLPASLCEMLQSYLGEWRPRKWLFEGQVSQKHITRSGIQLGLKAALAKAKLTKTASIKSLRYSHVIHLAESGLPLRGILESIGTYSEETLKFFSDMLKVHVYIPSPLVWVLGAQDYPTGLSRDFELSDNLEPYSRTKLYNNLFELFNLSDIKQLCFEMAIDDEIFGVVDKSTKICELIKYCERRSMIEELLRICERHRPNASWNS